MNYKPINLKAKALYFLSRRDYSYTELYTKLQKYTDDNEAIKAILAEMVAKKFLDEKRYIENFIHSKSQKYGSRKIKYLLANKVEDEDLINEVYANTEIDELEVACQQLRKKFDAPPTNIELKAKYMRFLFSRGFSFSIAQKAITSAYTIQSKE